MQYRREPIFMMATLLKFKDDSKTVPKKFSPKRRQLGIAPATVMQLTRTRYSVLEIAINMHYLPVLTLSKSVARREEALEWMNKNQDILQHSHGHPPCHLIKTCVSSAKRTMTSHYTK